MKKATKPKPKHRLARFDGWTAKKPGWPTGFGLTASLAHKDAIERAKAIKLQRLLPAALNAKIQTLEREARDLRRLHDAGNFARVKEQDDADGWVLMAMVITKSESPIDALGKMQILHNTDLTACEFAAATRVAGYLASWKKRLGA